MMPASQSTTSTSLSSSPSSLTPTGTIMSLEEKVLSLFSGQDNDDDHHGSTASSPDDEDVINNAPTLASIRRKFLHHLDEDTKEYLMSMLTDEDFVNTTTNDDDDNNEDDSTYAISTLVDFLLSTDSSNESSETAEVESAARWIIEYLRVTDPHGNDNKSRYQGVIKEGGVREVGQRNLNAVAGPATEEEEEEKEKDRDDLRTKGAAAVPYWPESRNTDAGDSDSNEYDCKDKTKKMKKMKRQQRQQQQKDKKERQSQSPEQPKSFTSPLTKAGGKKKTTDNVGGTENASEVGQLQPLNTAVNESLLAKVARIQDQSAVQIQEMDDYGSAWADVLKDKEGDGGDIIWGGRGHGGRGVNRGLAAYHGRDAVVHNLTLSYGGGRDLLHETHLSLSHGHRYGLMGANGVGKSTLLRRIASHNVPGWPMHLSVEMVEQEVLASSQSVIDVMTSINQSRNDESLKHQLQSQIDELESLLERPETTTSPTEMETIADQLSILYDELDRLDKDKDEHDDDARIMPSSSLSSSLWSKLDKRARQILKGLQFPQKLLDVPSEQLSGGWRMRLALARALYISPDFLLLDEPTNHLDISAVLFLESYLVDNNMTAIIVSHDGHFLDAVCTDMIKFENCKLKYHVGNYSSFREMEEQTWARNSNKADAVARKEKKAMDFIQKQRSMNNSKHRDDNKQRQAAERQKKFGRIGLFSENGQKYKLLALGNTKRGGANRASHIYGVYTNSAGFQSAHVSNEGHQFSEINQNLNFKFPAAPPLKGGGAKFIAIEDGNFRYPESDDAGNDDNDWLLEDITLNISHGSRVALVGPNGSGKSTLLKILCGELQLNCGEYHRHPNLKIAHIAQHHIEKLASYLEKTPVEYFMEQHKAKDEQEARQFLGGFGIVGPLALQMIGTLSGGQKARLAFATVMCDAPQLLILDEPTNHLDSDSLQSLSLAVQNFEGAVVIVSHNQEFMAACANEMWTILNGHVHVKVVDGETETLDDALTAYREDLRKELRQKKKK